MIGAVVVEDVDVEVVVEVTAVCFDLWCSPPPDVSSTTLTTIAAANTKAAKMVQPQGASHPHHDAGSALPPSPSGTAPSYWMQARAARQDRR
jgi:hypothetical protein